MPGGEHLVRDPAKFAAGHSLRETDRDSRKQPWLCQRSGNLRPFPIRIMVAINGQIPFY
jgi:hypothetical protein